MLTRDGSTYIARAEPDFLTANDAWFMPVAQKVGPDGCLYVLDWYDRYHCYQDANRDPEGIDRLKGRLYRVRYGDSPRAPRFDLATRGRRAPDPAAGEPEHLLPRDRPAAPHRAEHAGDPRSRCETLVLDDAAPRKARLHGLWALIGTGRLEPEFHARLLRPRRPRLPGLGGPGRRGLPARSSPAIRDAVGGLARDQSPDVQLQVAIAARKIEGLDPLPILVEVLSACGEDKLIPSIAWPNLHPLLPGQGERFVRLIEPGRSGGRPRAGEALAPGRRSHPGRARRGPGAGPGDRRAARRPGRRARPAVPRPSSRTGSGDDRGPAERAAGPAPAGHPPHPGRRPRRRRCGSTPNSSPPGSGSASVDAGSVRERFVAADQPEAIRLQALDALIAFRDPALPEAVGQVLAAGSPGLPRPRPGGAGAVGRSEGRRGRAGAVSRAWTRSSSPWRSICCCSGSRGLGSCSTPCWPRKLPRSTLDANHLRKILESNDREAIWAVEKAWGTIREERNPEREKVVAEMGEYLRQHPGDPQRGQAVFRKLCAQCHTIYGEGQAVGPDLTSQRARLVRPVARQRLRPEPGHRPVLPDHDRRDRGRSQPHGAGDRGQRPADRARAARRRARRSSPATT